MSEVVISARNLKKIYRIYDHPGDRVKEALSLTGKKYHNEHLALYDVNFEITKGEFFGILGRNGAGKSTLLKLLSRELTPTSGEIDVKGKVSLLQIGVGFDAELSGVENAKFASRVMGYSNKEIDDVVKRVAEFAEIGEFMNRPVKTYSTGMYSRLSFAIAINVDPEILIADEVLSVGDIKFSQKCLRKMHEFKKLGKTIILVSHDPGAVSVFCDRAMWIKDATVFEIDRASVVAEDYRNYMLLDKLPDRLMGKGNTTESSSHQTTIEKSESTESEQGIVWTDLRDCPQVSDESCSIEGFAFYQSEPFSRKLVLTGDEDVSVFMKVKVNRELNNPHFGWNLYDKNGLMALHSNNRICNSYLESIGPCNEAIVRFDLTLPGLNNGDFVFCVTMGEGDETYCRVHDIQPIKIARYTTEVERQYGYVHIKNQQFRIENNG